MKAGAVLPVLLFLLLSGVAAASPDRWTVQTVAFPDYRQAQDAVSELQQRGFDAYTEFTMFEDTQYARVRIGCFTSEAAAAGMAELLLRGAAEEAVVQPLSPGAAAGFCLHDDVGFIKPAEWRIQQQDARQIIFRVQLAGAVGYVRMFDAEWRLLTELEPTAPAGGGVPLQFRQESFADQPVVSAPVGGQNRIVCGGELLWQSGRTAVVERSSVISACSVEPLPAGQEG